MIKIDDTLRNVAYEQTTMEELLQRDDETDYDLVCCSEVIEHVHD